MKNLFIAFACAAAVMFAGCASHHHRSHRHGTSRPVAVRPGPAVARPPQPVAPQDPIVRPNPNPDAGRKPPVKPHAKQPAQRPHAKAPAQKPKSKSPAKKRQPAKK